MSTENLSDKVKGWVKSQGYPLEMRVAKAFHNGDPMFVSCSSYYADESTQKLREIDVMATWGGISSASVHAYVSAIVECKSSANPLVLFRDSNDRLASNIDELYAFYSTARRVPNNHTIVNAVEARVLNARPALLANQSHPCYGIAQVFKNSNDRDPAFDAVRQLVSATHGAMKNRNPDGQPAGYFCAIPALVVEAPIFSCSLDENGDIIVTETERELLLFPSPDGTESTLVHIVRETLLMQFVNEIREFARSFFLPPGDPE